MGELLLAGLSEEAQKTDQMGVEILSDTSSYMYGMRGAHHGQAGYTTLGEPESGLESLVNSALVVFSKRFGVMALSQI